MQALPLGGDMNAGAEGATRKRAASVNREASGSGVVEQSIDLRSPNADVDFTAGCRCSSARASWWWP